MTLKWFNKRCCYLSNIWYLLQPSSDRVHSKLVYSLRCLLRNVHYLFLVDIHTWCNSFKKNYQDLLSIDACILLKLHSDSKPVEHFNKTISSQDSLFWKDVTCFVPLKIEKTWILCIENETFSFGYITIYVISYRKHKNLFTTKIYSSSSQIRRFWVRVITVDWENGTKDSHHQKIQSTIAFFYWFLHSKRN